MLFCTALCLCLLSCEYNNIATETDNIQTTKKPVITEEPLTDNTSAKVSEQTSPVNTITETASNTETNTEINQTETVPPETVPQTETEPVTETEPFVETEPVTETESVTETAPVTAENSSAEDTSQSDIDIEVIDGVTYIQGILIVNKTYPLPKSYAPGDLHPEANKAYGLMKAAAKKDGITIFSKSAFRSYTSQRIIYNNYVKSDGSAAADRYSARPGHSEHQSGYAIDINSTDDSFGETPEGIWLAAHCSEFGFIIRYPKGKEDKTGYMYEPWHVRYVGVDLAKKITDSGLCLEEYFGITSKYKD